MRKQQKQRDSVRMLMSYVPVCAVESRSSCSTFLRTAPSVERMGKASVVSFRFRTKHDEDEDVDCMGTA